MIDLEKFADARAEQIEPTRTPDGHQQQKNDRMDVKP